MSGGHGFDDADDARRTLKSIATRDDAGGGAPGGLEGAAASTRGRASAAVCQHNEGRGVSLEC
eukprot:gene2491-3715_t